MNDLLYYIDQINSASDNAELSVMESLIMTYSKANMILESSSDDIDISSFDVFKETDVSISFKGDLNSPILGNKDESIGKRILMVIPRLIAKLLGMIKQLISRNKIKEKECEKISENIKDTLKGYEEKGYKDEPQTVSVELYTAAQGPWSDQTIDILDRLIGVLRNSNDQGVDPFISTMQKYMHILDGKQTKGSMYDVINEKLKSLAEYTDLDAKKIRKTYVVKGLSQLHFLRQSIKNYTGEFEDLCDILNSDLSIIQSHLGNNTTDSKYKPTDVKEVVDYISILIKIINERSDEFMQKCKEELSAINEALQS